MRKTTIAHRRTTLKKLLHVLTQRETAILEALYADFKKPGVEGLLTETNFVRAELSATIRNLKSWARPKRVLPSVLNFPSADFIYPEPYGNVLVISPWNYPFQLAMCPIIAAYAAGNSVVLKPSELSANTANLVAQIVSEVFAPAEIEVVQGGADVAQSLLERRWDYIFFTGSVGVGKKIAKAAAQYLTPVTLELGGKNPCIVSPSANLKLAAKRIVWGKFINAGQTCIAPDYLLVEASVKMAFIQVLKDEITQAFGENPQHSPDLARIVSQKHWERLVAMIAPEKVIFGGQSDKESLFLSPTLIDESDSQSALMSDEIFGPILPILCYDSERDLDRIIGSYEKPLALYVFADDREFATRIVHRFPFGGGCINDVLVHFANSRLPFGGVGHSGMGAYHGKRSFDTFVHQKAIVKKATWLDIPLRYAPYRDKLTFLRKWLKWF